MNESPKPREPELLARPPRNLTRTTPLKKVQPSYVGIHGLLWENAASFDPEDPAFVGFWLIHTKAYPNAITDHLMVTLRRIGPEEERRVAFANFEILIFNLDPRQSFYFDPHNERMPPSVHYSQWFAKDGAYALRMTRNALLSIVTGGFDPWADQNQWIVRFGVSDPEQCPYYINHFWLEAI